MTKPKIRPIDQIQLGDRPNFETLMQAGRNGRLALLRCKEKATGEYRTLVCAMGNDGDTTLPVPLAVMVWDDPFEQFEGPGQFSPVEAV